MTLRKYEEISLAELRPYDKNARTHSQEQTLKIARSLVEFGWTNPILIDEHKNIIAGHGRKMAADLLTEGSELPEDLLAKRGKAEDWKTAPVIYLEGMTEAQRRAYIIADNKLAELAGWDEDILEYEINALKELDFDITLTGFEIDDFGIDDMDIEEDPEPDMLEATVVPKAQQGDIYQLGRHRLMCGDSTSKQDVEALLAGEKAAMVFTDPPYNVDYESAKTGKILNDKMDDKAFFDFLNAVFAAMKHGSTPNAPAYVCYASREHRNFENALEANGYQTRAQIIWVKNIASFGFAQYKWKHEPILFMVPAKGTAEWYGDRKQVTTWDYQPSDEELLKEARAQLAAAEDDNGTTIWKIERDTETGHPTQKPVRIPARAILNSSKVGDAVLDLFGGSGSTLIAAEHTDRRAYLMELDPKYVDHIIERWQDLTGQKAEKVN